MNWNAKPEHVNFRPLFPKNQSFLEPSMINTPSQGPLNSPGSNHPACMFLSNSNPVSQPLLKIRKKTPQQSSSSNMHIRTVFASQALVERKTYANVKGSKQPNHSLQMSSGVAQNEWLNSVRNSLLSHTEATVSQQTGFRTTAPNVNALQNQFATPHTYSMQGHMVPSNYHGNRRLSSSLSERHADWTQQYTSNGLTYPDCRPHPEQYSYSSQSFLQSPTLQKQNPMPFTALQVNSHLPNSALTLQSKQTSPLPSYQYAGLHMDQRPPPPPYDCRYASQPLQNTQHVNKPSSIEAPQSQEAHFCKGLPQQNLNENANIIGNFCNVQVSTSNINQPFNDSISSAVDGVQSLPQNNQEDRADFGNLSSTQVPDTSFTKEKLVRDINTLLEIKKKFSELATKIKINKNVLMSPGCIKTKNSYSESPQNSVLSLKQTAKTQCEKQVTLVTPGTAEDKPQTVMETVEETNRTHSTLNSNIQDMYCRNFNQVNSILLNPVCSGKEPGPDQSHNLQVTTSLKTPTVAPTHAPLNNTQFSSGNIVNVVENAQSNSATIFAPQTVALEAYASKHVNKNRLLLSLLASEDSNEKTLIKDGCKSLQDSEPQSFEINANTQVTGNQLNLKTMDTPSSYNINSMISDNSFCLDHKSSPNGATLKSDSHLEVVKTCLSLWRKQPSKPTGEKQCNELTHTTAVGISKPGEICENTPASLVGNSQNKMISCSQVATLPVVVQNYESSGATATKGTELQIAVVTPLILSDVKELPVKGITPEILPEAVYPVIKEGSVCSLQNQLAENTRVSVALKVNVPVKSTTNNRIFPLIQKEKQNMPASVQSERTPNTNRGSHIESEANIHYLVIDQQASPESRDRDIVSSELLQIDNICSLVEGDTSYNDQIAKIFNPSPVEKIEPQKSSPNLQAISTKPQKEQLDNIMENTEFALPKDNFVQCTDVVYKIPDQLKSLQPPESSFLKNVDSSIEILEESNLNQISNKESTTKDTCSSAAIQQDYNLQEVDVSCNYTAQNPAGNEVLDNTSILYPGDQLSELVKEFPYGIEPVNKLEGSLALQITDQSSKNESCSNTSCDSKDTADQIKITILNSEQMKELFPEQNHEPCEADKLTDSEKENPVTKQRSHCEPQVPPDGESCNSVRKLESDDVRCCALGWLSMVYEGVPHCQCDSIKDSTSEVENGKDQCSVATNSTQPESTSDRGASTVLKSPPNNPEIALTVTAGKNHFPVIEQGRDMKDVPKTINSSLRTEQESSSLSIGHKKPDSLNSHKRKEKLKFHVVTQESLQQKQITQSSIPIKAKTGKNEDLQNKCDSSVPAVLPEVKVKAAGGERKVPEKRKVGEVNSLNSEVKRRKYAKQEPNKIGGVTLKTRILSNPDERAKVKEKTVSDIKSSDSESKDSSSKVRRVLTVKMYLERQKEKEAMGTNASKKNSEKKIPCDSQSMRPSKVSMQVGSCGKSSKSHSSSVQTSEESSSICSSHNKNLKIHHSEASKSCLPANVKETFGRKQPDKVCIGRPKLGKNLNMKNGVECSQISPQPKEQRKQYLNRVAFKCTESESICLTKLESLPKMFNKDQEKKVEDGPNSPLPKRDNTENQSILEFKLCPDGLIKEKTSSIKEQKDLQPCPRKEQAPVQVSGIKSSKEDWIKGTPEDKRIPEANQEIGVCNSEPLVQFSQLNPDPPGPLLCAVAGAVPATAAGRKRGPDELSAGITEAPSSSAANGNDSKKRRPDRKKFKGDSRSAGVSSRVICIGKLPEDATEDEVIFLGLPFGKVTNFLMVKGKNQAFIEMNTEEASKAMVSYYTSTTPSLRGQPVSIRLSNPKEFKSDSSHNQAQVRSASQTINSVQSGNLALAVNAHAVDAGAVGARAVDTHAVDAGAVFAGVVDTHAVGAGPVGAGAVGAGPVGAGTVGAGAVGAGPVSAGPVGAGAVGAGPVSAGPVGAGAVGAGAVGAGPVGAGPVSAGPVGAGPVGAGPVSTGAVGAGPVGAGPVGAGPVGAGPVSAGPVGAGAVGAGAVGAGAVDAGPVGAGTVGAGPVGAGPVGAGPIGASPVSAGAVGAGAVGTGPVSTGTVGAGPVNAGPVGAGAVGTGPVSTGAVGAGPVSAGPVGASPVGAGPVGAGPVGAGPVVPGAVGAGPVGAGAVGAGPVGAGPVVPGAVGAGPVGAGAVGAGPVGAGPMGAGPVGAGPVVPGAVGAGPVGAGAVGAGPVGAGPVGAGPVGAGPVGAGPVGAGAVGAGPVSAGPVGAGPVGAGPVGAGAVGAGPVGAGPVSAGPVGAGPVGAGAVGAGPVGAGPVGAGPVGAGAAGARVVDTHSVGAGAVGADAVGTGAVDEGAVSAEAMEAHAVGAGTWNVQKAMTHQCRVLRIIMEDSFYPVTLDNLHQIFSAFGRVQKIIIFTRKNTFQALLQYAKPESAKHAKEWLGGFNSYLGCTLHICFSTVSSLRVKYNSSRSRDYTCPDLSSGDSQFSEDPATSAAWMTSAPPNAGADFPPTFAVPQASGPCDPDVPRPLPLLAIPPVPGAAAGGPIPTPVNRVLLVNNLNPQRVDLRSLFVLFGVYGNVQRVKVFKEKDKALVQMEDGTQALRAMSYLNRHKLHGKPVYITLSMHRQVQLPPNGWISQGLFGDYWNSPLHRFRKPGHQSLQNISPPSATLYVANIPPSMSEDDLEVLFSSYGGIVKGCSFFKKSRKMARVEMGSVEEAIQALIKLHAHDLGKNHRLLVSFFKNTP